MNSNERIRRKFIQDLNSKLNNIEKKANERTEIFLYFFVTEKSNKD